MPIRDYLRSRAAWVWNEQGHAINCGLVLQEETITEMLLLRIAKDRARYGMNVKMFTKYEEGINGADWEWIFITRFCKISFRVQAKRLYPATSRYDYQGHSPKSAQVDKLIAHAGNRIPIYIFYNHDYGTNSNLFPAGGEKPYRGRSYWGCSIASAKAVKRVASNSISALLPHMKPWHRIVPTTKLCNIKETIGISPKSPFGNSRMSVSA